MMATAGPAGMAVAVRQRRAGLLAWLIALLALASAPLGQARVAPQASVQPISAPAAESAGHALVAALEAAAQFQADRVSRDPAAAGGAGGDPMLAGRPLPVEHGPGRVPATAPADAAAVPGARHSFEARAPPAAA